MLAVAGYIRSSEHPNRARKISYAPLLFSAVIAGAGWIAVTPATAASLDLLGFNASNVNATPVEKVGYWKRLYRRYGYPPPYAILSAGVPLLSASARVRLRHPFMATNCPRRRPPILHPCMAMRLLHLPPVETTHPQKATTATRRPQRETIRRPTASTAIIPRMALRALSQNSCHLGLY